MFLFDLFLLELVKLLTPKVRQRVVDQEPDDTMTYLILDELDRGARRTGFSEPERNSADSIDSVYPVNCHEGEWE